MMGDKILSLVQIQNDLNSNKVVVEKDLITTLVEQYRNIKDKYSIKAKKMRRTLRNLGKGIREINKIEKGTNHGRQSNDRKISRKLPIGKTNQGRTIISKKLEKSARK